MCSPDGVGQDRPCLVDAEAGVDQRQPLGEQRHEMAHGARRSDGRHPQAPAETVDPAEHEVDPTRADPPPFQLGAEVREKMLGHAGERLGGADRIGEDEARHRRLRPVEIDERLERMTKGLIEAQPGFGTEA